MQLCYFNFFMWIWAVLLNFNFTVVRTKALRHKCNAVSCEILSKHTELEMHMKLYICDDNVQKYQFSNLAACYFFITIFLK